VSLKVSEVIKLVEADGSYLDRVTGSHRQFRHAVKPGTTTIAGKPSDTLPPGTEEHPEAGRHWAEAALTGYAVILERGDDGGYGAWSPDLPGCVAVSDSYDECVRLMREAISLHVDSLRRHGEPIPQPSTVGVLTIGAA